MIVVKILSEIFREFERMTRSEARDFRSSYTWENVFFFSLSPVEYYGFSLRISFSVAFETSSWLKLVRGLERGGSLSSDEVVFEIFYYLVE